METEQLLVDATLDFMSGYIRKAKITIDDIEKEYEITKSSIRNNTIRKYVFLTTETGVISSAKLIDAQGRTLRSKNVDIKKGPDGFMIVFVYRLIVEEDEEFE